MSDTISELFARDPLSLTKEDLDAIIRYYRDKRAQFALNGDKTAGNPKRLKEKPATLEDLGL